MSDEEKSRRFIFAPKEGEQPVFPKSAVFKSLSERIVDDFLSYREETGEEIAKVKVPPKRDPRAMARGIGKILSRKLPDFTCRIDESGELWIIKR